ncbi:MAG: hypothetical protein WCI47_00610 [bacterium]
MTEKEHRPDQESMADSQSKAAELKDIAAHQDAERNPDKQTDQERSIEQAREVLKEKSKEKPQDKEKSDVDTEKAEKTEDDKAEKSQDRNAETKPARTAGKRERQQAYQSTMKLVQQELSPAQRSFSKLIHAAPVEYVSEFLEETFFRPSFLWGGVIGAILFGGLIYVVAYSVGFQLSGSEFTIGLLVGGLIGFIIERILSLFGKKSS